MSKQSGFTLIELMVTLALIAIVLMIGVPSFRSMVTNNRVVAQANELATSIQYARSEAIKRTTSVSICSSTNQTACDGGNAWATGWLVFTDANSNGALDGGDTILRVFDGSSTTNTLTTTVSSIVFQSTGLRPTGAANVTLTATSPSCTGNNKRIITVGATGRSSMQQAACP